MGQRRGLIGLVARAVGAVAHGAHVAIELATMALCAVGLVRIATEGGPAEAAKQDDQLGEEPETKLLGGHGTSAHGGAGA